MTDRELLELAAKAADIGGRWGDQIDYHNGSVDLTDYWVLDGADLVFWNPLADDGDALRLAIRLGIVIDPSDIKKGRSAYVSYPLSGKYYPMTNMEVDDEEYAMRRLIVRAAADIGKSMEKSQ